MPRKGSEEGRCEISVVGSLIAENMPRNIAWSVTA